MERFKRIIVILVSAALLVAALAIPVSAHQIESVNLLDSITYEYDGEVQYTSQKMLTAGSHTVKWYPMQVGYIEQVTLTVYARVTPRNVVLQGLAPSTYHYFAEGYHQYTFNLASGYPDAAGLEYFDLSFTVDNDTDFSLVSCIGSIDNIDGFDRANFVVTDQYFDTYGVLTQSISTYQNASLPFSQSYNFIPDDFKWQFSKAYIEITLTNEMLAAERLDYVHMRFISTDVATVSAHLQVPGLSNNADPVVPIVEEVSPTGGVALIGEQFHNLYYNFYTFDLSGLDLTNRDLVISIAVDAIFSGAATSDAEGYYISIEQIYRGLPQEEKPWYTVFADWLSGQFDRLIDALGGNSEAVDQVTQDMQQSAGALDQAGDALDSIAKPDTGDITGAVDNVLAGVDIDQYGGMLGGFFDSAALSGMMITVAVLALCSYALFGKKG